jgi:Fic family protein
VNTLQQWETQVPDIPMATVWLLNELAEYRGKQELYTQQAPRKLEKLREHAVVASAVSSNRIEGVEIDSSRVGTVVFGHGALQDRNEEEIRGYQQALRWIHEEHEKIPFEVATILRLHRMCCPSVWDSGCFKDKDGEIIEKHSNGKISIRFVPVSAQETPSATEKMCQAYRTLRKQREIPPLLIWAAMNLDFLCIHPFRDGNGRVSRLLLLLSLYQLGFTAGRYISLESVIEQSKERYYATLKQCSDGWHDSGHDAWSYINYLLYTLKIVYVEFEERVGAVSVDYGEKTMVIRRTVKSMNETFHVRQLQKACPGISLDMIRKVLKDMRKEGAVECIGRGKKAEWRVMGNDSG